jgi:hypothetical protein
MTDDGSDWLEPDPASQPESRDDSAGRMARGPWFVRFAGRRSGPFDVERLRTMARRKALTRMHAVSVDGTTWASAVTLRAVFNADGSVVSGPALAVEHEAEEDRFGDLPDGEPLELPSAARAARRGSALVRPAVISALALATVVLALPTWRDASGAVGWWWSEGAIALTLRALAALSVVGGWVLVFLPAEIRWTPVTLQRFRRFRSIRRGWWSLLLLAAILVASLFAELWVSNRALFVRHNGNSSFPSYGAIIPGTSFGLDYAYETNYRDLKASFSNSGSGTVVLPLIP